MKCILNIKKFLNYSEEATPSQTNKKRALRRLAKGKSLFYYKIVNGKKIMFLYWNIHKNLFIQYYSFNIFLLYKRIL